MTRGCVLEAIAPANEAHISYSPSGTWSRSEMALSTLSPTVSKFGGSETQPKDAMSPLSKPNPFSKEEAR